MDADQFRRLEKEFAAFLDRFGDCFSRKDTRADLGVYVRGQLSDLPEKSVEPIALEAGVAPRTLQEFLSQLKWDEDRMRDRLQQDVAAEHAGPHTIGIIDETSDVKKGDKTPGVQKQWSGRLGKTENCIVTVHLGFARDDFHCLLDGELFLPESWDADRDRCREAGIPDSVVYRPKWQIGLELHQRAVANGLVFEWLTFDEGYGSKPEFLRELSSRDQKYVGEVPRSFAAWLDPPRVVNRRYRRNGKGRSRKVPRLASGSPPTRRVDELLRDQRLSDQPWKRFHVKDGEKGPMVWECKHTMITIRDAQGLPGQRLHLLVARNVLEPDELKFFVSNGPMETRLETLLLVAFSRWRVERCFEDDKSEIGLDQYEGRRYLGLKRHLIISAVSYLFLARVRQHWGKKNPELTVCQLHTAMAALVRSWGLSSPKARGEVVAEGGDENKIPPTPQCAGSKKPLETGPGKATTARHHALRTQTMHMGHDLAL